MLCQICRRKNPDHTKRSEDKVAGIEGETRGKFLQQQGQDIRSGAVVIGKLELGDAAIPTDGTQKCVYPARARDTPSFISCEAVFRITYHDHGEKCRDEECHGDLICAPPRQPRPLTEHY